MQKKTEIIDEQLLNDTYLAVKKKEEERAKYSKSEYLDLINSMHEDLLFIKNAGKKIEDGINSAEKLLQDFGQDVEIRSLQSK